MDKGPKKTVHKMSVFKPTAKMVAEVTGATINTVNSVKTGRREKGNKTTKIIQANALLEVGINNLLAEVKRVVNF